MNDMFPFTPVPMDFGLDAFSPYLIEEILDLHYNKVYAKDLKALNSLAQTYPKLQGRSLERLIGSRMSELSAFMPPVAAQQVPYYAGSVYSHGLYFGALHPKENMGPHGKLKRAIERSYGTVSAFEKLFSQAAGSINGVGWVWLNSEGNGKVHISLSKDAKTPDLERFMPIFSVDAWEHSYYIQYPVALEQYVSNWFKILNWEQAEIRFRRSLHCGLWGGSFRNAWL